MNKFCEKKWTHEYENISQWFFQKREDKTDSDIYIKKTCSSSVKVWICSRKINTIKLKVGWTWSFCVESNCLWPNSLERIGLGYRSDWFWRRICRVGAFLDLNRRWSHYEFLARLVRNLNLLKSSKWIFLLPKQGQSARSLSCSLQELFS